jgi:hypothetical protein
LLKDTARNFGYSNNCVGLVRVYSVVLVWLLPSPQGYGHFIPKTKLAAEANPNMAPEAIIMIHNPNYILLDLQGPPYIF